ncbi:MAG: hypothetical protein OEV73_00335 [Desulfobulbaceae bacterium]|nr:hypothetical protein [Desulfobulbaceae bacterium]
MSGNKHYIQTIAALSNLFYGASVVAGLTPKIALARLDDELGIKIPYTTFMKYLAGETCCPTSVVAGLFVLTEDPGLKFVLEPLGWELQRRGSVKPGHLSPVDELMDDITAATITHSEIQQRIADCQWSETDRTAALAKVEAQKRELEETEAAIRNMPIGRVAACQA